jgi:hypothetical protein
MQINLGKTKIYFTKNSNSRIRLIIRFFMMHLKFIDFIKKGLGSFVIPIDLL